jgi:hypothetical protein
MSSLAADLAAVLDGVRRPGDFCVGGVCRIFAPALEVEGVGPIALPLLPVQADQLIALAERAPFGRGEQTLVDTEVRRAWQIAADRVRIGGQGWSQTLAGLVERVAQGLGVDGPVEAELYKLLVYEQGGFFVGHRDTEKAAGMFATLVVVLPSTFTGGELTVRHRDREARFDLRASDPSEAGFAAFFADCLHEVSPVTTGARLTLIYNLLRRAPGETPQPPGHEAERDSLAARLARWAQADDWTEDAAPRKLIYLLEHAYTPAELAFQTLKGADAARAATLAAAARSAGCDLHLALLTIEESGSAEHTGRYRSWRRGRPDDEDEFEIGEIFDSRATLSGWRGADGEAVPLGALPFDPDQELSPPDSADDLVPDDVSFSEATGNEGATFDRTYRRAALALWPSRRRPEIIDQGGLAATLPWLADRAARWSAAGADRASPLWAEAHDLAGRMVASWPMERWRRSEDRDEASAFLDLLGALGDSVSIESFLETVCAGGVLPRAGAAAVLRALGRLARPRRIELAQRIVAGAAPIAFAACADLLAKAVAAIASGDLDLRTDDLRPAALALLAALPGDPAGASPAEPWERPSAMTPAVLDDALTALDGIDPALADAAAQAVLARSETWNTDKVVVPALLGRRAARARETSATSRLRTAALAHLRSRIAEPLAPPRDWTRPAALSCGCEVCGQLAGFLADPGLETWTFKAAQASRSHLETRIRNDRCDVDFVTLRRGMPHSLVCTKNQASYEARARQRRQDLDALDRLEGPLIE